MAKIQEAKQVLADELKAHPEATKLYYEVKDRESNLTYVIEVYAVTPEGLAASRAGEAGYPQGVGSNG